MSTEPEREIEKQLKAYASKRREQAGAPAELHPATRKLLQGEVARTQGKPGGASAATRSFWTWRRQWAVGLAAACVVAALVIALPSALKQKSSDESAMQLAKNDDTPRFSGAKTEAGKSVPMNKPAEAATGLPPAPAVPAPMLAESSNAEAEKQKSLANDVPVFDKRPQIAAKDSVATNRELALGAANRTRETFAAPTAPPAPAPVTSDRIALEAGARAISGSVTNTLTAQAGEPADRSSVDKSLSTVRRAQSFADSKDAPVVTFQFAADDTAKAGFSVAKKKVDATVLNSFRVEQTGEQLRVIDGDGSVYTGFVETPGALAGRSDGLADRLDAVSGDSEQTAKNAPAAGAPASRAAVVPQTRDFGAEFKQTTNGVFFRVNGTNVTLGKRIVFSGKLIAADTAPATNSALATKPSGAGGGSARASGMFAPAQPPDTQIRGRVVIDGTNQLEIRARSLKRTP